MEPVTDLQWMVIMVKLLNAHTGWIQEQLTDSKCLSSQTSLASSLWNHFIVFRLCSMVCSAMMFYHLFADAALCPLSWLHELCTAIKQVNHHQSPARSRVYFYFNKRNDRQRLYFSVNCFNVWCKHHITKTGSDASVWSTSANKTISEETGCFKCLSSGRTSLKFDAFVGTVKYSFLNQITLTEQPNLLAVGLHETT